MSEVEETEVPTVNVKIRSMNGQYSSMGVEFAGDDSFVPKLRPGEVMAVPLDHGIFDTPGMVHLEVTRDEANRAYRFGTLLEAQGQYMSPEHAIESSERIAASIDMSTQIRRDNLAAIQRAKDAGTYVPEAQLNEATLQAMDQREGLNRANTANSVPRGGEQQVVAQDTAPAPAAPAAPAGRSRRGNRT